MIDLLDRYLDRLLEGCGADAAVIWTRIGQSATGSVICTRPAGLIASAAPWPVTDCATSAVIQQDPAMVAALVPTSVRLELPRPPKAALSTALTDTALTLLLIWYDTPAGGELPADLRALVDKEITYAAVSLARQNQLSRDAQRLEAVIGDLRQGVVSVDHSLDRVTVNAAAANLLGLGEGDVAATDFAAAMAAFEERALNKAEFDAVGQQLIKDGWADVDCTLRFGAAPTHVRVSSHAVRQGAYSGRVWVFDDVSAAAQALEASQSAQALMRASADSMLDPQVLLEAVRDDAGRVVDFRYLSANWAACAYLGLQESDLVGHTQLENSPNLEGSDLQRRYVQCLEDGQPVVLEDFAFFNEILDDARRYDIQATRAGANRLSLTWRDVTERFQSVQRITESEERFRLLAENVGDVVCRMSDDGTFLWVSSAVQEALGAPPQHYIGRKVWDNVFWPVDRSAIETTMKRFSSGEPYVGRTRFLAADGTPHWVHLFLKPYLGIDGQRDGMLATFRVIDDEVAAEQQVEEARQLQAQADARYLKLMDNAAVGMCVSTPDGLFETANDAMCQFFGYDAEALKQMTWQQLTAPDYLEADLANVEKIMTGQVDSYRMTKQFIRADGQLVWGDLSVSCLRNPNGDVERFIAQITDITATVEANERNVALNQRMTAELRSAATYIASIMPAGLKGEVDVASRYLPSRELGGDCFDYSWIDDDHLIVYLLDVSGHGIEPALLAVSVQNVLRSGTFPPEVLHDPAAVLAELNRLFQMEQQNDHFFTIWYGVYEASTRTLRYATAGAPPALAMHLTDDGRVAVTELSTPAEPVGAFEDTEFTSKTYSVPPGDRILIFSDGAHELSLSEGRLLSLKEFKELNTRLAASSNWSLDGLVEELRTLAPAGVFEDDCSLIQLSFD